MNILEQFRLFTTLVIQFLTVFYAYQVIYILKRKVTSLKDTDIRNRFAIFISARNEEGVISELLDSLNKQDYPRDKYDIYVVADNCTDHTAQVSRDNGAIVYERFNKEEVGKYDLSNDLSASKNFRDNPQPLSDSEEAKIDSKIQKTKEYKDAVEEAQETEAKWESGGFNKYGNVDNFNRDKIDWTKENLEKYKDFVAEQNKYTSYLKEAEQKWLPS